MTERVVDVASQTIALLRCGEFCDRFGVRLQPSMRAFQFREQGFGVLTTCALDTKGSRNCAHEHERHTEEDYLLLDLSNAGKIGSKVLQNEAHPCDRGDGIAQAATTIQAHTQWRNEKQE